MRYFNIMMDSPASGHSKMVICTLNNLQHADTLLLIIRACVRTFRSLWNVGSEVTGLERPYFYLEEDLNYDPDCGSFYIKSIAKGNINEALAVLLDHEIDMYINDNDLWTNRVQHEVYDKAKIKASETE